MLQKGKKKIIRRLLGANCQRELPTKHSLFEDRIDAEFAQEVVGAVPDGNVVSVRTHAQTRRWGQEPSNVARSLLQLAFKINPPTLERALDVKIFAEPLLLRTPPFFSFVLFLLVETTSVFTHAQLSRFSTYGDSFLPSVSPFECEEKKDAK